MRLAGFGEILPYADNRVTLNHGLKDKYGLPTLTTQVTIRENEKAMRRDMQAAAAEMLDAAGFKTSVLNAYNQVHECRNVYVTDGAAMTSASCVNPSLTYMALTARACDHAVNARKRGEL